MYEDRSDVRTHIYTVRANDVENDVARALARYLRKAPTTVMREIFMEGALAKLQSLESAEAGQQLRASEEQRAA